MTTLRIIGDVHGKYEHYLERIKDAEYSVCVGDMGFSYTGIMHLDPTKHVFVPGNHDNYDNLPPHALPNGFGVHEIPDWGSFFYVRGAWSVDHRERKSYWPNKSHWREEEMTIDELERAFEAYCLVKPDFVITHTCPKSIIPFMNLPPLPPDWDLGPERTPRMLDRMLEAHKPKIWVYGHFHKSYDRVIDGCRFKCFDILEYQDIDR